MARYDKYDPKAGGFRAALAADWLAADVDKPIAVGLNASGQVVKGAGASGLVGVIILTKARYAGDVVDIMTAGEITEFGPTAAVPNVEFGAPGSVYYGAADGAISTTAGGTRVGHTVEASRLVVRFVGEAA